MQTATNTSGGHKAANPGNINHQPVVLDVRDYTTRCFNRADEERRDSYYKPPGPDAAANPCLKSYSFGNFGNLRTIAIDGQHWCSLNDAGQLAGLPVWAITGTFPDGRQHIRGLRDHLSPDGIRDLGSSGIPDIGIRLEALAPIFLKARGAHKLTCRIASIIAGVYAGVPVQGGSVDDVPWPNTIRQHRYYGPREGEFRMIIIGTQVWINLADVSRFTVLAEPVITTIAGSSRTVAIPNSALSNADNSGGSETYVRFDAVGKLLQATEFGGRTVESLEQWISQDLITPANQLKFGHFVRATTLHKMLGQHLDFPTWVGDIRWKNPRSLNHLDVWSDRHPGDDFQIVLTEALAIALREGGPAGEITAMLIRDGGGFHNGKVTESADDTLKRFQGLVPDRSGRVDARAVHAFIRDSGSFDAWVQALEGSCSPDKPGPELYEERISLHEADRRGLWQNRLNYRAQCSTEAPLPI